MKRKLIALSIISTLLLVFASFSSVACAQNITAEAQETNDKDKTPTQIKLDLLESIKEKNTNEKWFPGFMLVQLVKGVLAFFLVLLILLDIIEPENTTG